MSEVPDHFARLGLPRKLALTAEDLEACRDRESRVHHPDQGGSAAAFAAVNDAYSVLRSPARRTRHLLELLVPDAPPTRQASLPSDLGDLFMKIGPLLSEADELEARRTAASSALVRALLADEEAQMRDRLEDALAGITTATALRTDAFPSLDEARLESEDEQRAELLRCWSALSFLEKWETQVRTRWAQLAG